jgi:hypothetical protein
LHEIKKQTKAYNPERTTDLPRSSKIFPAARHALDMASSAAAFQLTLGLVSFPVGI